MGPLSRGCSGPVYPISKHFSQNSCSSPKNCVSKQTNASLVLTRTSLGCSLLPCVATLLRTQFESHFIFLNRAGQKWVAKSKLNTFNNNKNIAWTDKLTYETTSSKILKQWKNKDKINMKTFPFWCFTGRIILSTYKNTFVIITVFSYMAQQEYNFSCINLWVKSTTGRWGCNTNHVGILSTLYCGDNLFKA